MLTFSYKARDTTGAPVEDTIEAPSKAEALRLLQRDGRVVTDIRLGSAPIDAESVLVRQAARGVAREDVIAFTAQLSIMLETGVPMAEALRAFTAQTRSANMRRVVEVVTDRVIAGANLSDAIAQFPRVFPNTVVSLVRASEASGTMATMLGRISEYLAKERKTVRQIRGALTYPFIMVSLAVVVTGFLITHVLPRFAQIYASREAALPGPTKFVLGASEAASTHWPVLAGAGAALVAAIVWARVTRAGRTLLDTLKIRLPVIGPMFGQFYLTRATRTLGTLLASGITLLEAVRIVRGVTNNAVWTRMWDAVEEAMTAGQPVSSVMAASDLVPPSVGQMIAAGERTGRLPTVLDRVAASAEEDLETAVRSATQLIEPAMILFMGVTIGGLAIAMLLPIFSIANVMGQ